MSWASRRSQRDCAFAGRSQDSLLAGLAKCWPSPLRRRLNGRAVPNVRHRICRPTIDVCRRGWGTRSRSISVTPTEMSNGIRGTQPRWASASRWDDRSDGRARRMSDGLPEFHRCARRANSASEFQDCAMPPMCQQWACGLPQLDVLGFCENETVGRRQVFEPTRNLGWNLNLRMIRTIRSFDREFRSFEWILIEKTNSRWRRQPFLGLRCVHLPIVQERQVRLWTYSQIRRC